MSTATWRLQGPVDGVSKLDFSPANSEHLISTAWDGYLRVYDTQASIIASRSDSDQHGQLLNSVRDSAPLLACCFGDGLHAYFGGFSCGVRCLDLNTGNDDTVATHDDTVSCLAYASEPGMLVSGSWDRTLRLWDTSQRQNNGAGCVVLPEKVYSVSAAKNRIVVGMANRVIHIYDPRHMQEPLQIRESSLKYMTRAVACNPDGTGFATSSVEGRVAIEFLNPSDDVQANRFAFKCHRQAEQDVDVVYPVNALSFHPRFGTFATGGGDGYVALWDPVSKKRLKQYHRYPLPVSDVVFSHDGDFLAVGTCADLNQSASSNTGSTSTWPVRKSPDQPSDYIYVRRLASNEGKGK